MNTFRKDPKLVARAKEMALEFLNRNRRHRGMPPLEEVEELWWEIHGREFFNKAWKEAQQ